MVGACNVLIVDDDPTLRMLLRTVLELDDYVVHEAAGGEEAIDFLTSEQVDIDLVILDVCMPGTCGWETLEVIRDSTDGWPCQVIMLTAVSGFEQATKAWEKGASFVAKPFEIPQLLEVVDKIAKKRSRTAIE